MGLRVSVFISIKLARQARKGSTLRTGHREIAEVMECYLMTGERDYLLRVVGEDLGAYEASSGRSLPARGHGLDQVELRAGQVKYSIALPV